MCHASTGRVLHVESQPVHPRQPPQQEQPPQGGRALWARPRLIHEQVPNVQSSLSRQDQGRQDTAPRRPILIPGTCDCALSLAKGDEGCSRKLALRWGDGPGCPGGAKVIAGSFKGQRGAWKPGNQREGSRRSRPHHVALQGEGGAVSRGMRAPPDAEEGREWILFWRLRKSL